MVALSTLRSGGNATLAQALAALERDPDSADTLAVLDEAYTQPMAQVIGLAGCPASACGLSPARSSEPL